MNEADPLLEGQAKPKAERFPSLITLLTEGAVLTNSGSTARDHLANERTYLAWLRTGLSIIGASLALLKWDYNGTGYVVAIVGIVVLINSTQRYFRVMQLLEQGKFEPNVRGILILVSVVAVAIVAAFVLHHFHAL